MVIDSDNTQEVIAVAGLGYVGFPLAVAFSRKGKVIAYDTNPVRREVLKQGEDYTEVIQKEELLRLQSVGNLFVAEREEELGNASVFIIAVPTRLTEENTPDLNALRQATGIIAKYLHPGALVIYESTVYPGATEEVCIPILESVSGLQSGRDFKVGYSPERINPGDPVHCLENVKKIVSGQDAETLERVASLYEKIISVGVYRAASIKVAEASKIVENSQRDFNIAYVNYLSQLLEEQGIESHLVLEAASTKWNFLPFQPGLVGGHCIGLSSYYLTYRQKDKKDSLALLARSVNESVPARIANKLLELMELNGISKSGAKVGVLGLTFKENCADVRNSGIIKTVKLLQEKKIDFVLVDSYLTPQVLSGQYQLTLSDWSGLKELDALILATPHKEYRKLTPSVLDSFFAKRPEGQKNIVLDIKGILSEEIAKHYIYWRL